MFSLSDSLTVAAAFGNFLLGLIVLIKSPKKLLNITFSILSFATVLWILSNFVFSYYKLEWILRSQYAMGSIIMPLALIWVYVLTNGKLKVKETLIFLLIGTVLFSVVYLDGIFISNIIINGGNIKIIPGPVFDYFSIFTLALFAFFIGKILFSIKEAKSDVAKTQLWFTFWGVVAFAGISIYVGFVLPFFNIIPVGPYDAQSSLFFVGFSAYAILRYKLFNLKIISTELLVSAIWIFLLVRILLAVSVTDIVINTTLLVLMIILGSLLMKSVYKEVESREKIQLLATDLQKANDRLTELDRQKSEFVSFATHQLRAPLTAMKGYASLILEGDMGQISAEAKQAVTRIFDSTKTLASIVDDYLNITRIELGSMKYAFDTIDMKSMVEDVIGELKPNINAKPDVQFSFTPDPKVTDFRTTADRDKLKQVIANLIDNSIKYTPKGWVKVTLTRDPLTPHIVFKVEDNGIGIDPEVLPHLFMKFSRAPGANKVNIKGTGLGLFVAKEIITAHHGTIRAESPGEGKGSSFIVELEPFAKA